MMKQNRSIFFVGWQQGVVLALACLLYGLLEPAYCRDIASAEWQSGTDTTVLLMQQSDSHAGAVTPDVGVHHFDLNAEVLLTAVPKPGYYFVYWIGDVSDPTAISTIIYMDAPKIVLAVFARSEFSFLLDETLMLGGGGNGGLRLSAEDYSNQSYTGGGSKRYSWPTTTPSPTPEPTPEPTSDEFPVPEEIPDEFPIPAPEPATVLLLGLGSLLLVGHGTKR
jgi:hypothetical protein